MPNELNVEYPQPVKKRRYRRRPHHFWPGGSFTTNEGRQSPAIVQEYLTEWPLPWCPGTAQIPIGNPVLHCREEAISNTVPTATRNQSYRMLRYIAFPTGSASSVLGLTDRHKRADDQVLAREPLLPALQGLELVPAQALQRVKRAVQVLGQHVLVEAPAGQAPRGVPAGEVLVGAAGAVEVPPGRDVEDAAPHGQVDRHAVLAVVGEQCAGREGAEDGGWWLLGDDGRRGGLEGDVEGVAQDEDQEDVEGCDEGIGIDCPVVDRQISLGGQWCASDECTYSADAAAFSAS